MNKNTEGLFMTTYAFDDREINWQKLEVFDNFQYFILNIDKANKTLDLLFKFEPNSPIVLHRHCALNHTFVIDGEHCIYNVDGTLKEVRPTGSYTVSPPDVQPHRECGKDKSTIVFFSIRNADNKIYEILDDEQNIIVTFGLVEFEGLQALQ